MNNGFIHNHVLITPVETAYRELGALTQREYPVDVSSRYQGYVDLFVVHGKLRTVCEAELSCARIRIDVAKAVALKANLLLVIAPNRRVAQAIRRKLSNVDTSGVPVCCLTVHAVIQILRNKSLLKSAFIAEQTLRLLINGTTRQTKNPAAMNEGNIA